MRYKGTRFNSLCYTDPDLRDCGQLLRSWILAEPDDPKSRPICSFLKGLLSVPAGAEASKAIIVQALKCASDDWLRVPSPMPRHRGRRHPYYILVPNVWKGMPRSVFKVMRWAIKESPRGSELRQALFAEIGRMVPKDLTFKRVLDAFESILPLFHPPALIEVVNWSRDVAWPHEIDLLAPDIVIPEKNPQNKRMEKYPKLKSIRRILVEARQKKQKIVEDDLRALAHAAVGSDGVVCDIVVGDLVGSYLGGLPRSRERLYQALPIVVEAMILGKRPPNFGRVEDSAFSLIQRHGAHHFEPKVLEWSIKTFAKLDPQPTRVLGLYSPDLIDQHYCLTRPFPNLVDDEKCALRFMTILMARCGRRACDLIEIQFGDATVFEDFFDLEIPSTKVSSQNGMQIPLHTFFHRDELEFTRDWLASLRSRKVSDHTLLFELMGLERCNRANSDKVREYLVSSLNTLMLKSGFHSTTHLPRHFFASWWPVICLCARNRELLTHEKLAPVRNLRVFSDKYLDQVLTLIAASADSCSMMANLAMGHSQSTELFYSYCRSWPLLIALNASSVNSLEAEVKPF